MSQRFRFYLSGPLVTSFFGSLCVCLMFRVFDCRWCGWADAFTVTVCFCRHQDIVSVLLRRARSKYKPRE